MRTDKWGTQLDNPNNPEIVREELDLLQLLDEQLANDLLEAFEIGLADGGFGPPVYEIREWQFWEGKGEQPEALARALRNWLQRKKAAIISGGLVIEEG